MYITNITDDYDNCPNTENEDLKIFLKYLLLSKPSSILLIFLKSLMVYTLIKSF